MKLAEFIRRRSTRTKQVALSLVTVLVVLIVAESVFRIFGVGEITVSRYRFDALTGSRLVANHGVWQTSEGHVFVTTNQHGLRDHPHTLAKPPNTYRIAVLGDSFTEATQVEIDETFCQIAEKHLNKCGFAGGGQKVQVLNFGVSGFGTAQQLLMLQNYVWQFEPDMIVLAFFPDNDVRNNSKTLEPFKNRPFYELVDGELMLDRSGLTDPDRENFHASAWIRFKDALIRRVRLLGVLYQAKQLWNAPVDGQQENNTSNISGTEKGLDSQVFAEPTGEWITAWSLTDRLVAQIAEESIAGNAKFALMIVPSGVRVEPDATVREQLASSLGVDDLGYADRRVEALVRDMGFPVIQLTDRMEAIAKRDSIYMHGFENATLGRGHWNRHGHAMAGRILAEELCTDPL